MDDFYKLASVVWWSLEDCLRLLGNKPKKPPIGVLFSNFQEALTWWGER